MMRSILRSPIIVMSSPLISRRFYILDPEIETCTLYTAILLLILSETFHILGLSPTLFATVKTKVQLFFIPLNCEPEIPSLKPTSSTMRVCYLGVVTGMHLRRQIVVKDMRRQSELQVYQSKEHLVAGTSSVQMFSCGLDGVWKLFARLLAPSDNDGLNSLERLKRVERELAETESTLDATLDATQKDTLRRKMSDLRRKIVQLREKIQPEMQWLPVKNIVEEITTVGDLIVFMKEHVSGQQQTSIRDKRSQTLLDDDRLLTEDLNDNLEVGLLSTSDAIKNHWQDFVSVAYCCAEKETTLLNKIYEKGRVKEKLDKLQQHGQCTLKPDSCEVILRESEESNDFDPCGAIVFGVSADAKGFAFKSHNIGTGEDSLTYSGGLAAELRILSNQALTQMVKGLTPVWANMVPQYIHAISTIIMDDYTLGASVRQGLTLGAPLDEVTGYVSAIMTACIASLESLGEGFLKSPSHTCREWAEVFYGTGITSITNKPAPVVIFLTQDVKKTFVTPSPANGNRRHGVPDLRGYTRYSLAEIRAGLTVQLPEGKEVDHYWKMGNEYGWIKLL